MFHEIEKFKNSIFLAAVGKQISEVILQRKYLDTLDSTVQQE